MRILVSCFLILVSGAKAQNYLWPTDAEPFLSSSFCEFRPGHFHSGIDIKTWNKEGYKCYAIADGFIEKIRVSPFGYGKVVYLRLHDGNIAVYAHLQRFTKEIDRMVREIQIKNKKYRLTWYPKNIRVKRGETIGYTGRTGIGVPHLHFEIRNSKEQPLNPLAYYKKIKDTIRPQLQNIAVLPLSPGTIIDNAYLPQVFELKYIKKGRYQIKAPIPVRGKAGLAVRGFDQADGVPNKFAFYNTRMSLDGREVFQINYDLLDFDETSYIDAEIHHPFWVKNKEVFHKLYIDPYNKLSSLTRYDFSDGSITVSDKIRNFKILISDYHGNISTIEGSLVPYTAGLEDVTYIQRLDDWLYLKLTTIQSNSLKFLGGRDQKSWLPLDKYEIMGSYHDKQGETILAKINIPDSGYSFIKASAAGREAVLPLRSHRDSMRVQSRFSGKRIIFSFDQPCTGLQLTGQQLSGVERIKRTISGNNQSYFDAGEVDNGPLYVSLQTNNDTLWQHRMEIARLLPAQTQRFYWFDSSLILETRANALFDTTLIEVKQYQPDSMKFNAPIYGNIMEILPDDIALLSSANIQMKTGILPENKRWGVFALKGEELSFQSDVIQEGYYTFGTNSFGKYIIASDTIAPVLQVRSPISGKSYKKNPQIDFSTKDELSGVDGEEEISIVIDSSFVLPEWDPEDDLVKATIDNPLPVGEHILYIEVKDFLKNAVRDTVLFHIQ